MTPTKSFTVFGEPIDVLVPGEFTAGRSATIIQTSPPGGGPPPHAHENEDEIFYVLEGNYEFLQNGKWSRVEPGEAVCGMRGSIHTFRNAGHTEGRMLIFITPAGLERYFEEISPLAMPWDLAQLLDISERFGISFQL
ncbi:MAG TPA: cupin domain-containing protein [Terracidiphilus sp.]|nr:cupin domain-containing protein [Terracidiphilus sp.]